MKEGKKKTPSSFFSTNPFFTHSQGNQRINSNCSHQEDNFRTVLSPWQCNYFL